MIDRIRRMIGRIRRIGAILGRRRLLIGLAVVLAVALVAGTDGWIIRHYGAHAAADKGSDSYLNAVACASPDTCWAVGQTAVVKGGNASNEVSSQLIRGETAGQWHDVSPPATSVVSPALIAVTCPGPRDCWAVGGSSTHGSALIEHWTGGAWQIVKSPHQVGARLQSVTCATQDLCWAVGGKQSLTNITADVLERWNGVRWHLVSALSLPARVFSGNGVSAHGASATDTSFYPVLFSCPQSGHCLILGVHNGIAAAVAYRRGRWATATLPPGLQAGRLPVFLACARPDNCLALVRIASGLMTQEWNGHTWTPSSTGLPRYPAGLNCTADGSCWLLGASGTLRPVALRWQDGHWAAATLGKGATLGVGATSGYLGALACAQTCWAVGGTSATLADGTSYSSPLVTPVSLPGS